MTNHGAVTARAGYRRFLSRLIRLRQAAGLSQSDLAARLGWSRALVSRVESGERRLDPVEFHRFCAAIGVDDLNMVKSLKAELERSAATTND